MGSVSGAAPGATAAWEAFRLPRLLDREGEKKLSIACGPPSGHPCHHPGKASSLNDQIAS